MSKAIGAFLADVNIVGEQYVVNMMGHDFIMTEEEFNSHFYGLAGEGDKLDPSDIKGFFKSHVGTDADDRTTLGISETVTGFKVYTTSTCASPENYKQETGLGYCIKDAEDEMWSHLGFVLLWGRNGVSQK